MLAVVLIAITALGVAHVVLVDTFQREAADNFRALAIIAEVIFVGLLFAAATTQLLSVAHERSRHSVTESLAEAFSAPRGIEEIGQISVAHLVGSGVASAALLAVTKEDGHQLEPVAACGYPPHWQIEARPANGLIPPAMVVRQTLNLADPWLEPLESQLGPQPWVARIPIVSGDEVLGMFVLANRSQGLMADTRLLRIVSTLIAAALDHAQLYVAAYGPPASDEDAGLARHDLVGAIASELQPALVSVEAHASVVADDDHSPGTIEDARRLAALSRSIERLNLILRDLTALGSEEELPGLTPPASTDIGAAVRAASEAIAPAFEARNQTITVELPDEPVLAIASADAVERLMLHMLSNANRSAPDEGHIVVRASTDGDTTRIEVEDSGPALDPLERNHIFEPFYRVARGVPEVPGAGLGLAVARQIAESQGGTVWAAPHSGGGASYYIDLPSLVRAAPEQSETTAESEAPSDDMAWSEFEPPEPNHDEAQDFVEGGHAPEMQELDGPSGEAERVADEPGQTQSTELGSSEADGERDDADGVRTEEDERDDLDPDDEEPWNAGDNDADPPRLRP